MLALVAYGRVVSLVANVAAADVLAGLAIDTANVALVEAPAGINPGDYYANGGFSATPPINIKTTFSKLTIMQRFSQAEMAAIYTAAQTNVSVQVWLDMFKVADLIDVTDPATISGINALVSANLLASARVPVILSQAA